MIEKIPEECVIRREKMWNRMVAHTQATPRFSFPEKVSFVFTVHVEAKRDDFISDPGDWFQRFRKTVHINADQIADEMERYAGLIIETME